jgi:DNA-binding NtrC family response regulator
VDEKILLVDDDPSFLSLTRSYLIQKGMEVIVASNKSEAVEAFDQYTPSLVILDVYLPDGNGIDLIPRFRNGNKFLPIILVSGQSEIEEVVRAMQMGATDYVKKPFDYEESGTGKDLVARAIHKKSINKDNTFVKVNCAALPYELLESELFGYEKGAFTGAYRRKLGKFELASSGSIFLDEISEMPVKLQSKLLQVVQDRCFSRVGGERDIEVNTRIIAATNKDLESAVKVGAFREDLYYRINVVNIHVPPLRERKNDVPVFVERFLDKYSFMYNKKEIRISDTLLDLFTRYYWPGNIRELENYIKRVVLMESDIQVIQEIIRKKEEEILSVRDLRSRPAGDSSFDFDSEKGLNEMIERMESNAEEIPLKEISKIAAKQAERKVIEKVLNDVRWNRRKAAKILQISYKALLYKMKDCGIVQNV